jgi:hypothetical protein
MQKPLKAYKNALRNNPTDEETRYNYALAKLYLKNNPEDPEKDKKTTKKTTKIRIKKMTEIKIKRKIKKTATKTKIRIKMTGTKTKIKKVSQSHNHPGFQKKVSKIC